METVKLEDGKILVILSKKETEELSEGFGAEAAVAALLPGIAASGFANSGDTLGIELFEDSEGGCQIFITREERERVEYIKSGCSVDPSFFEKKRDVATYRFEDLSSLL